MSGQSGGGEASRGRLSSLPRDPLFWAELGGSAGLGLWLFFVNDKRDLGVVSWVLGALLLVHRLKIQLTVAKELQKIEEAQEGQAAILDRMSQFIDLTSTCDVDALRALFERYRQITEDELRTHKNRVIQDAYAQLNRLYVEKRSNTMLTGEYYSWLNPKIRAASPGSRIWAVSRLLSCEWDSSPEEEEFLEANLEAAARGVHVERIFLCEAPVWSDAMASLEPVRAQLRAPANMSIFFGDTQKIRARDARILPAMGDGLIAFDDEVVLVDEHSEEGLARGYALWHPGEISRRREVFERLMRLCSKQAILNHS